MKKQDLVFVPLFLALAILIGLAAVGAVAIVGWAAPKGQATYMCPKQ
jgi:hypothetical protein